MIALTLPCAGCGGYFPLRWPSRELWSAPPTAPFVLALPLDASDLLPARAEADGVTVSGVFPDPARTLELFHAHLLRNRVQPLLLRIHNGSGQAYRFTKADVDARVVPASEAGRWACTHPVATAARFITWGAFLLPGVLFESVVEPATTMDFPIIEESAKRPAVPACGPILAEFIRQEIADGEIGPDATRAGVLFLRPPALGAAVTIRLVNARTRQPLVLALPTPPARYETQALYSFPKETVWEAAVRAAGRMKSWRVTSSDPTAGIIEARHGIDVFGWTTKTRITVTVREVDPSQRPPRSTEDDAAPEKPPVHLTQVALQSTLRRADSAGVSEHSRTIDRFFSELPSLFPAPVPPPAEPPSTAPY